MKALMTKKFSEKVEGNYFEKYEASLLAMGSTVLTFL